MGAPQTLWRRAIDALAGSISNISSISGAPMALNNIQRRTFGFLQVVGATLLVSTDPDYVEGSGAGGYIVTLPGGATGKTVIFKNNAVAAITLSGGGPTIVTTTGAVASISVPVGGWAVVFFNGAQWLLVSVNPASAFAPLKFSSMWDSNVFAGPVDMADNMSTFAGAPAATYANPLPILPGAGPQGNYPITSPCTLGNLRVNLAGSAAVAGAPTLTVTMFLNGVATAVVAGFGPPLAAPAQSSNAGTVAFVPGDTVSLRMAIAGGAARVNVLAMLEKT